MHAEPDAWMEAAGALTAAARATLFRKDGTAQGVAKQRLIESIAADPSKRVIEDPFAECFVTGASIIKCMGHDTSIWLTAKITPGLHEHLITRTRVIDEFVKHGAAAGAAQYVVLGAGYDMRAYRLDLPASLKVFEVDQEEVQELKKSRMPREVLATGKATYVSVDFNTQTLGEQLTKAGFQKGLPTIVSLEGVTQYIPKEAAAATLKEMGSMIGPGSTLFVSYVDERMQTEPAAICGAGYPDPEKKLGMISTLVAKVGEPWISYYGAAEMKGVLSSCGFALSSDTTMADTNALYFGAVGREVPTESLLLLERFAVANYAV